MKAALAISPDTPSTSVTDSMGESVDMILVMTVHPGKGGQKFIQDCVQKVKELRERFPGKDIEVDGGVGPSTVGVCAHAGSFSFTLSIVRRWLIVSGCEGANVIVSGTAVFGAENPKEVMEQMRKVIRDAQKDWPKL